jgi:ribonuclease HI
MSDPSVLTIHTDGAARGNPGPAAFAYVIRRDGQPAVEEAGCLGSATNNVAEYTALVRALERAAQLGGRRLLVCSDSELLVKQMNGLYKVKNDQLKELFDEARRLVARFDVVQIKHVRRAENSRADALCNQALDGTYVPAAPGPAPADRPADVRARGLACLTAAAMAWKANAPDAPTPEEVWEHLQAILNRDEAAR